MEAGDPNAGPAGVAVQLWLADATVCQQSHCPHPCQRPGRGWSGVHKSQFVGESANRRCCGCDASPPRPGDEVLETVTFDNIPLPDAIRQLANLAAMNIQFEPRLANPQDANHHPIPSPTVNEKMKKVTALQAMQRLLDEFGWQATQITGNPILRIEAKAPKAPDASAKPPQPR